MVYGKRGNKNGRYSEENGVIRIEVDKKLIYESVWFTFTIFEIWARYLVCEMRKSN